MSKFKNRESPMTHREAQLPLSSPSRDTKALVLPINTIKVPCARVALT